MKYLVLILGLLMSSWTYAAPQEGEGVLIFPAGTSYQVERAWPETGIMCTSGNGSSSCQLEAGTYKWLDWTEGTEGFYTSYENNLTPDDIANAVDGLTTADVEAIVARLTGAYLNETEVKDLIMVSLVDIGLCPAGSSIVGQ